VIKNRNRFWSPHPWTSPRCRCFCRLFRPEHGTRPEQSAVGQQCHPLRLSPCLRRRDRADYRVRRHDCLAGAGLSVVLQTSEWLFHAIKIIGAAYLLYLAWQLWRANPEAEQQVAERRWDSGAWRVRSFWWRRAIRKRFCCSPRSCRNSSTRPPGAGAIRRARRAVPATGMDRHQRLCVDGPAHAPLVRRAARQTDLQPLLRGLLSAAASVLLFAKRA
jgi:hypothetical protein